MQPSARADRLAAGLRPACAQVEFAGVLEDAAPQGQRNAKDHARKMDNAN